LTNLAVHKGNITVFGGSQLRPNLHIQDYADLCKVLLEASNEKIANEVFNCGYENMSIMEIAETVKRVVAEEYPEKEEITLEVSPSDDLRSYHINSDKVTEVLGFKPQLSVEDAIRGLCQAFKDGKLPNSFDDDNYFNVRTMMKIGAM
jgi:nucleoside-diphosphate-sugar epimerase